MFSRSQTLILVVLSCLFLTACSSSIAIKQKTSVGQNERVQSLVLHFTAGNYKRSLFALRESGAVSSHYLIPDINDDSYPFEQLEIIQLVPEHKRAWHAGHSYWQGRNNLNDSSIGIEIVNRPECQQEQQPENVYFRGGEYGLHMSCDFPEYSTEQVELLVTLAKDILARNPDITPTRIVGHSDIAPARKSDPGPKFPWYELSQQGVGAWYDETTVDSYLSLFELYQPEFRLIQKALKFYGYKVEVNGVWDQQTADVIYAFQSHFTPKNVTGELTNRTSATIFALLDKYHNNLLKVLLKEYYWHAELAYSNSLISGKEERHKWLSLIVRDNKHQLNLTNLSEQALTLLINGEVTKQIRVPAGVSAISVPLPVEKGEHWLELVAKQDISELGLTTSEISN